MYSCINPFQFVKEDEKDYLIFRGNQFYIQTKYAGRVEITKEYYEKMKRKGMVER